MELKGVSHSPFSHNDMFVYLGYFSKLKTCSNGIPCLDGKGHLYVEEGALASRHKFLMAMAGLSYFNNEVHFKNKRPALASSISMLPDGVPYHIQGEGRIEDRVSGSFGPLGIRFEYAQGPAG